MIKIIAALSGLALFSLFGFVAAAAYSASESQCPDGSDCQDAMFAMIVAGGLAIISLTLTIPLCRVIWRMTKGR
ncbi:hypothetical protein [Neorhizobium tomejilense]|uniref:hypothetical protein n=1 Tax=Neorhizobium tomejilense TaxID=2093828 RepID=UPI000CF95613|nr:hypothetical protein [Neorhizobium tomejilense]